METGEISVEGVSRRFRIHAREAQTLKDLFVQRGRTAGDRRLGASRRLAGGCAAARPSGSSAGTARARRRCSALSPGSSSRPPGRSGRRGRIGSLLELGAGFHPDFTGRENVFLNGAIQGLRRADIRERFDEIVAFAELEHAIDRPVRTYSSGMTMRLGFAIAAFLDADVLLLDEVFAVGDEAFQRKCFGRIFRVQAGGRDDRLRLARRVRGRAALRALRAARRRARRLRRADARGGRRATGARSRTRPTPAERGAGLREWGSGEASIASAALVGEEGAERLQFLSGEPFALRVAVDATDGVPPPRLQLELRDDAGTLVAGEAVDLRELGWASGNGERALRFDIGSLPLADGRFHLRLGLTDEAGERLYHWLDDALVFVVYPGGDERGVVRFEGSLDAGGEVGGPMTARTCPDWPELMELDPDLQFKHYTVAEAQLPAEVLSSISHVSLGEVEICCDLEHHVFNPEHTDPEVCAGAQGLALVRRARVGDVRPRHGPQRRTPPEYASPRADDRRSLPRRREAAASRADPRGARGRDARGRRRCRARGRARARRHGRRRGRAARRGARAGSRRRARRGCRAPGSRAWTGMRSS